LFGYNKRQQIVLVFLYPRAVCRISFSRAQKATEKTWGMDEQEDADLSYFFPVFINNFMLLKACQRLCHAKTANYSLMPVNKGNFYRFSRPNTWCISLIMTILVKL